MSSKPEGPFEPDIARDATYYRASEALRERVQAAIGELERDARKPSPSRLRNFISTFVGVLTGRGALTVAAMAAVALVSWNVALMTAMAPREDGAAHDVLAAHMRALMASDHGIDVVSSDQHTVKPWFAGKLDFAPPVRDLAADGYPLVGGRLDYVRGRPVAALAYKLRLHSVSLFIWPETGAADSAPKVTTANGYTLVTWTRGAMRYWAASDAAPVEITRFADLLISG